MSKILLSASVAALALGMSAPTFAQDLMLYGTPVPADQVERIQERCDELFTAESGMGVGTEQETSTTPESTTETEGTGASPSGSATDTAVDFATLDLTTIDATACREGGFIASVDATAELTLYGTPVPADQVDRIRVRCDELLAAEGGMGAGTEQETSTTPDSTTETEGTGASPSGTATDTEIDFATLDLTTIDAEACRLGGFTVTVAN